MSTSNRSQPHSLVQVYALTVCFSSLVCLMVALGVGLYDVLQIASPEFTLPGYEAYSSNESFARLWSDRGLAEPELTRVRLAALSDALAAERQAALQSGAFALMVIAIDVVAFAFHWRLGRNTKLSAPEG